MKQTPIEIGSALKNKRLSLKITLEDASKDVRIMQRYLQALEDDEFSKLPSEVVLKGFLKNYCDYLGLDPKPLIDEYVRRVKKNMPHLEPQIKQADPQDRRLHKIWDITVYAAAAVFIFFLIVMFVATREKPISEKKEIMHKKKIHALYKDSKDLFKIEVEILDPTWLIIFSDDKLVFSGMLYRGRKKIIKADKSIWMKIGNAKGVRVSSNGKILMHPGERGEVIKKEFFK